MQCFGIGAQELKMARLLWERDGIGSGAVVQLCAEEMGWKKSTTYTMLHRVCEHGLFQNVNSIITSLMNEEDYNVSVAEDMVNDKFGGSLLEFVSIVTRDFRKGKKGIFGNFIVSDGASGAQGLSTDLKKMVD